MHITLVRTCAAASAAFRRHRLLVVLPVFLLAVVVTVRAGQQTGAMPVDGAGDGSTSIAGPSKQEQVVRIASGVQALMAPGAMLARSSTGARLQQGSALLAGRGLMEVQAGPFTLLGWSGGFSVTVRDGAVTVASLTTPIVVRSSSGRIVVPLRSQGTWTSLPSEIAAVVQSFKPLPPTYMHEQMSRVQSLMGEESRVQREEPGKVLFPLEEMIAFLRLPLAQERASVEQQERRFDILAARLHEGDRQNVLTMLQHGMATGLPGSTQAGRQFLAVLPDASRLKLTQWFLPPFLADRDRWLLASLHPDLREHAWTLPSPAGVDRADRFLRLLLLPEGDVLREGPGDLVIDRWGAELSSLLHEDDQPLEVLEEFLPSLTASLRRCLDRGHPYRAKLYAAVLLKVIEPWLDALYGEASESARFLQELRYVGPPAHPFGASLTIASSSSSSVSSASFVLPEADIHARAVEALRTVGAMFTVQTAITPMKGTNAVRIRDIVFATLQGDQLFRFTYDVMTNSVFDVEQDGRVLPYTVTLEKFVEWVQRR